MESANDIEGEIRKITSQNPNQCYQCGKCSAGCPLRSYMDFSPNQIIRFIQLGHYEKALKTKTIWLCAGCMTCTSRCPKNFETAKFMDALREIAISRGIEPADKDTYKFHESFINQVKRFGRSYELGLIMEYKLKSGNYFQDIALGPKMFFNGKINLFPKQIMNKPQIQKIFKHLGEK